MAVTEPVPAGTTFASVKSTVGSCTSPAIGGTGAVTCSTATLGNGASFTVTLVVTVTARNGSTVMGTASVSVSSPDPNSVNNIATVSSLVGKH